MTNQQRIGKQRRAGCFAIVLMLALICGLAVSRCHKQDAADLTDDPAVIMTEPPSEPSASAETASSETDTMTDLPAESPSETGIPTATGIPPMPEYPEPEGWALRLVNSTHPLPDQFSLPLTELSNGVSVDSRIYPDLQEMFDAMRMQGISPFVREGFRTREYQQSMMDERIQENLAQGCSEEEAEELAHEYVADPGTSEHELGLAVDINAVGDADGWTVYTWLAEHAHEYGFILRYPEGKEDITGIAYEPWHYRYVGRDAAAEIYERDITLEEYTDD